MSSPEGNDPVEPVEEPDPNTPAVEESDPDSEPDDKVAAKVAKANREAQNLRARVKALEAIEKKFNEQEQAKLSELEKVQNQLKQKDDELAQLLVSNYRRDAALSAGLTGDDIEFITGTTEEECLEQAKKLAKRLAATSTKPAADLRQGNRGATPAAPEDGNTLIRRMAGFN
jgi:ribosomal protein L16 Arg81 hydroxylase